MPSEYIVVILIALLMIVYAVIQASLDTETETNVDIEPEIRVVCSSCDTDLVAAKTRGIQEAMNRLAKLFGEEVFPANPQQVWPITFHLDGDNTCGQYQSGMTGFFTVDNGGLGHVCLFDVEKENRSLPFTVENAEKIEDQLLPIHEAMHGWFIGRQANYRIQEPFCKFISFIISEFPGGPEYCGWFSSIPDNHPDVLMRYLCEIGMTSQSAVQILRQVAKSATDNGRTLSDVEFADIVTSVLGTDAIPAFRSAGILP